MAFKAGRKFKIPRTDADGKTMTRAGEVVYDEYDRNPTDKRSLRQRRSTRTTRRNGIKSALRRRYQRKPH